MPVHDVKSETLLSRYIQYPMTTMDCLIKKTDVAIPRVMPLAKLKMKLYILFNGESRLLEAESSRSRQVRRFGQMHLVFLVFAFHIVKKLL